MTDPMHGGEIAFPADQIFWEKAYEECGYTYRGIARISGIDAHSVSEYIRCLRVPRKKNLEKMEKAMQRAVNLKRIPFHPSYGFATEEQIHKLKTLKKGVMTPIDDGTSDEEERAHLFDTQKEAQDFCDNLLDKVPG